MKLTEIYINLVTQRNNVATATVYNAEKQVMEFEEHWYAAYDIDVNIT